MATVESQPIPPVLVEDHGAVRLLTLNRPQRRNAMDLELRTVLGDVIEAAMAEASIRALVLTGAGGAFCSGGDISTMAGVDDDAARWRTTLAQRVTTLLRMGPKPVIAAVEGAAFGAGWALALACDRVVAASDARFNTAFTAVGLAGDLGITFTLPARVGVARARQLMLFHPELSGEQAAQEGLVDAVVEPGAAVQAALRDAARLALGPPLALAAIKRQLDTVTDLHAALQMEAETQRVLFASDDLAEGVAAFHDKRRPDFQGR